MLTTLISAYAGERDPFESPLAKEEEALVLKAQEQGIKEVADLELTGIMLTPSGAQAIINRKIVKVGDIIEEKKIVTIKKDYVILFESDTRYILRLKKQ